MMKIVTEAPIAFKPSVLYEKFVKFENFDLQKATYPWACVMRQNEKPIALQSVMSADALFYMYLKSDISYFSGHVLRQLLLRPSPKIREIVESFEKCNNFTNGYNAIHLRQLEGSCLSRVHRQIAITRSNRPDAVPRLVDGSEAKPMDICKMSSDYIRALFRKAGTEHLPCFLAHDHQDLKRAEEIKRDFHAVSYDTSDADGVEGLWIDMILLIRSSSFVGNSASTLSHNVADVRRVINKDACCDVLGFF